MNQKLEISKSNILYDEISWIGTTVDYKKYAIPQLQSENQKILKTLKTIENKITKQLNQKNQNKVYSSRIQNNENIKALEEKIKNNQKLISALKKDQESAESRKQIINEGLESKTIEIKFALQRKITKLKSEIRQMKLEEHATEKRLVAHGDFSLPQNVQENQRMQEQLRVYSIKYVRLLDKYNKSTEKLALASKVELPDIEIPEIYDKQLQEREKQQYKEYQGIVKLGQVLSHRNDSEHNKAHREYTLKLKQLERIIFKLGQLDQAITVRQGQLIESKKNIQLIKVRLQNGQSYDTRAMMLSQSSIPRGKSYSTAKLPPANSKNSLRSRGYSMARLKLAQ